MGGRMIAIGDIHGCRDAFSALIDAISPDSEDTLVILGDCIDRGPDTRSVLDQLIALAGRCQIIPLMGDHEEMLLQAISDFSSMENWLKCGGVATLKSYGWSSGTSKRSLMDWIPEPHRSFLAGCRPYYETATHLFVHAGYLPELPMDQQPGEALRWRVTDRFNAKQHQSGKVAVVGHTAQLSGEILNLGFLVCIDTNCFRGGWLTAFDTATGQVWQADSVGKIRHH